ncbi:uncharacterized protein M437DRAFT_37679 [Aureobasidium melanogenum CBS 110374]|uniref:Uncharacterized protein n=1 Tax=Aureobasidium melanogenum (strain CBS 110374) TaxID=1043003 RepID=A0A074WCW6_AURM1|nr:uncharacterized protein M437DRAFT_37679 [Aureobasidium melanogenum CBS 110374]KEQ67737.1 hypothetical protein M437DRAFT_37679 [Aureobasidium melanogenum CBS 110374]
MLRASTLQKAGALAKHGLAVAARPDGLFLSRLSALSLTRPTRSYATTPKHIRRRQKAALEAERPPAFLRHVELLRHALDANDVRQIASAYNVLRNKIPLGDQDVADIAKALHTSLRLLSQSIRRSRIPAELSNLADLLVLDIQAKVLPPSYDAHLHLLSFYKESAAFDKGTAFWSWLVKQGDDYVNANLYGVALELFAFQGRPAEETEQLYESALDRFPGVFLQYHLAHNAVIADRRQPTVISGIPKALLQGILTARILRGDAKNAYLTLDTALRLFPTRIPTRFVTLFVQERPLDEAYKVFMLACQAGATPGHDALKILLTRLRKVAATSPIENASLVRAMMMACYAHNISGAPLNNKSLNELVIAITVLLKDHAYTKMSSEQLRPITDAISGLLSDLFGIWASVNSPPGIASFNSMIANLAGRGKRKDIIDNALEAMEHYNLKPNTVTFRSILSAAGEMEDSEGVRSAWTNLVAERIEKGAALELVDWQNLLNAVRRINDPDYLQQQLFNFQHIVSPHILDQMSTALQAHNFSRKLNPEKNDSKDDLTTKAKSMRILELLKRDIEYLSNNVQVNRNLYTEPMSLLLLNRSSVYTNVPEDYIRTVYDEMTTDSSTTLNMFPPSTSESRTDIEADADAGAVEQTPAMGPTGYPLDELRYQNWKTINELLFDAKLHDKKYMDAVDEAIKLGTPPPSRDTELSRVPTLDEFTGLCDSATTQSNNSQSTIAGGEKAVTLDEFRERIFELRGRKA